MSSTFDYLAPSLARVMQSAKRIEIARLQREDELRDLHLRYTRGDITIDADDKRTMFGFTPTERAYITGKTCGICMQDKCQCDDNFDKEVYGRPKEDSND